MQWIPVFYIELNKSVISETKIAFVFAIIDSENILNGKINSLKG